MERNEELEEQVRRLSQTVEEMRVRMATLEGRGPSADVAQRSDRRGFLRLGAGAVLGALGLAASKVIPAAAADNGNMILGNPNLAEHPTTLAIDSVVVPAPLPAFSAAEHGTDWVNTITGTFQGAIQGLATPSVGPNEFEGVDGWASGTTGAGVYGLSDTGYGVIGESSTGIAMYARASGRIRQDGPFAGMPGHAPNAFEQVRDSSGVLWIHNANGVWRRVNSLRADTADGSGAAFKPVRRIDTRSSGGKRAAGSVVGVAMAGQGSGASFIPADAVAVVGNLTATSYTGGGFLAIMPFGIIVGTGAGQYNPNADPSSLNFQVGQTAIANSFVCGLSSGALQVYVGGSASNFIVDITAYVQ